MNPRGLRHFDPRGRFHERRAPHYLFVDNGSEFSERLLDLWPHHCKVRVDFGRRGKPTDNGYVETFVSSSLALSGSSQGETKMRPSPNRNGPRPQARAMHSPPYPIFGQEDPPSNVISIRDLREHCAACSMRELCLPIGLDPDAMQELDTLISTRHPFRKGESIFRSGDEFVALYAIRSGSCKVTLTSSEGQQQVSGFHMMGDMLGFDGIASGHHVGEATALETTEVCTIPFARLEELCRRFAPLQHNLHQLLSREVAREQNLLLVVGGTRAPARVAAFLLNLSERYHQRGYSSSEFVLRMTRAEIGSYLGLKLETVSRVLSRFQAEGLIRIQKKAVKLLDRAALRALLDEPESPR